MHVGTIKTMTFKLKKNVFYDYTNIYFLEP